MTTNWFPPRLGVLCVAVLLVTAGCTNAPIDGSTLDAETIAENVQERHEEIDDLRGVQRTTVEFGDETTTTTLEVWERSPDQYRQEVRSSTAGHTTEGDVTVANESGVWSYSASDDVVRTFEFESDAGAGGTIGTMDEAQLERFLETFDVEHLGTDTVADRDVHVIRLTPSNESAADDELAGIYDELKLWVDEEYWYPLQQRAELTIGGESQTVTTTFEEIEFNADVADERFAFDPPEGAEIVTAEDVTRETFDGLEAASDAAPFDVAAPDEPDGYSFETATVIDDGTGTITVSATYAGPDDGLWLSVTDDRDAEPPGEEVTVDGTEATLVDGRVNALYWTCGDLEYSLSGDLERTQLVETAASIDCP
ncbi:outer membrane lipoprotein-sorting protein [Halosolutus gelatinilyticus]|uniref:outer membrane lipoprotein-sorting protein n=1 Tax=Halosolutus gelatinilyticus TaxID=2931975 RepID=UPI001FF3FD1B|nr:outer membrane lipoprotein-sorting protein [Halosolutus gelatinilyticus]